MSVESGDHIAPGITQFEALRGVHPRISVNSHNDNTYFLISTVIRLHSMFLS